ncbi:MAG: dihydrodipicolinate synthase family protein [Sedimentisphaerales bacterium]
MAKLTSETFKGIWAGTTLCWDENYHLDEKAYAKNIEREIKTKVHGIYTSGSTGEFYALDFDEFHLMVDIQADLCGKAGMPLQIGCCSDATAKTIKLLEYAAGKKAVGSAQVCLPYWMELTDREVVQFFKDIYTACPNLPLVHYNIPRAKRFLGGKDYLRILDVAPSLIGVKYTFAGSNFGQLQSDIMLTPNISYLVGETMLVSGMLLGAKGTCSAFISTANPQFVSGMYADAVAGNWPAAITRQKRLHKIIGDMVEFISSRNEGLSDPVIDKGVGVASGGLFGHQRCRAPYIGWSDDTIIELRKWMTSHCPELVYPERYSQ